MKFIGLFRENAGEEYKPIKELISDLEMQNKEKIVSYLKGAEIIAAAPAIVHDQVTGDRIGTDLFMMTDGEYRWMSDLAYYVEKYNFKLPDEFIAKALGTT